MRYIEIGSKEAGAPKIGGNRLTGSDSTRAILSRPTIFAGVTENMTIAREEIFGPVLAVDARQGFRRCHATG